MSSRKKKKNKKNKTKSHKINEATVKAAIKAEAKKKAREARAKEEEASSGVVDVLGEPEGLAVLAPKESPVPEEREIAAEGDEPVADGAEPEGAVVDPAVSEVPADVPSEGVPSKVEPQASLPQAPAVVIARPCAAKADVQKNEPTRDKRSWREFSTRVGALFERKKTSSRWYQKIFRVTSLRDGLRWDKIRPLLGRPKGAKGIFSKFFHLKPRFGDGLRDRFAAVFHRKKTFGAVCASFFVDRTRDGKKLWDKGVSKIGKKRAFWPTFWTKMSGLARRLVKAERPTVASRFGAWRQTWFWKRKTKNKTSFRKAKTKRTVKLFPKRRDNGVLWVFPALVFLGLCLLIGGLVADEIMTSEGQARVFSSYGRDIAFSMETGANADQRYPAYGPYNERLGYRFLPFYIKALRGDGFSVVAQMRASETYNDLLDRGVYPIYRPKAVAGLTLYDRRGEKIFGAAYPRHVFRSFDAIPPLLVNTLLFIENRQLLEADPVTKNPVIEWPRLFYAIFGQLVRGIVPGIHAGGGSTLATQTEKFRFSPQGQTSGVREKIKQIVSASLRVYLDGPDTREARKRIVLDYLNSTPLSARPGFGEINSIGDGLWAWFGLDLKTASEALRLDENRAKNLKAKAKVYRAALGLILAQRRPSYYLQNNHKALDELINGTLARLAAAGQISERLWKETKRTKLAFVARAPAPEEPQFIDQKAVNALRTSLMNLLGIKKLYELDRLDLSGRTSIDRKAQSQLVDFLKKMGDVDFVKEKGLYGFRLLKPENDPSKIKWSVVLYEQEGNRNKIRLQADTIDGPFDMNDGMKLDLGSTAKLRTLVTYLEIIAELHRRYAGLGPEDLEVLGDEAPDKLTSWAIHWLEDNADADVEAMLRASLKRKYSGNTSEVFFTGGGVHVFKNFERKEDYQNYDLHGAFKESVNLVFVRLMRDIVNYTIAQGALPKDELLTDAKKPARKTYLERFADHEGAVFLGRYISTYAPLKPHERFERLLKRAHKSAVARAVVFRSINPEADIKAFGTFLRSEEKHKAVSDTRIKALYEKYAIDRYSLADRGYLAGLNPMELWLVGYWVQHPKATYRVLMNASRDVRIESYAWLYGSGKKKAQNTRIRIMLEKDAFKHIHKRWERLGYPFDRLVPSYATAIGSSADRPGALGELVGIILAGGVRMPVERFEALEFAHDTPFQTLLETRKDLVPQRVLSPAVAKVVKDVMREVVEDGTATRVKGIYHDVNGEALAVGGKTGTGDQRYEEFASGGKLISSRVVNRTGTFVFYIGDRFFGTITAHVAGEEAGDYVFTSALSAQMLKILAPIINPVINEGKTKKANPAPKTDKKDGNKEQPKADLPEDEEKEDEDAPVFWEDEMFLDEREGGVLAI